MNASLARILHEHHSPWGANRQKPFRADGNDGVQDKAGPHPFPVGRGRRGGNEKFARLNPRHSHQPPSFPLTYYVIPAQAGIQKGEMRQPCVPPRKPEGYK
jgi:hypothetical protein